MLAAYFADARAAQFGYRGGGPAFSDDVLAALTSAPWPGNVRELDGVVQRLLVECAGDVIDLRHCTGDLAYLRQIARTQAEPLSASRVLAALAEANGCKATAARRLRTSRQTLYRYLRAANTP